MIEFSQRDRVLILVESGILLAVASVVVSTPDATGYEISVYEGFPTYFFILLFASYLCGLALIATDGFSQKNGRWVLGLGILIVTTLVFLSLPVVRGYHRFLGGDAMFHIGQIKSLLSTGYVPDSLIYPALHVLVTAVAKVTASPAHSSLYLTGAFSSIVFIGFAYLLTRSLNVKQPLVLFTFLLLLLLPGPSLSSTVPFEISSAFIIFILYLTLKTGQLSSYRYRLTIAVVLVSSVLMHILIPVYTAVGVGLLLFCSYTYPSLSIRNSAAWGAKQITPLLIGSMITAYLWLSEKITVKLASTAVILSPYKSRPSRGRLKASDPNSVTEFSPLLPDFLQGTIIGKYLSVVVENSPNLKDLVWAFTFEYGYVVLILAGVAIVTVYQFRYDSGQQQYFKQFLTVYFISLLLWSVGLVVNEWSIVLSRFDLLSSIFGFIIISTAISEIFNSNNSYKKATSVALIILLVSTFSIGFVSTYASPIQNDPSPQKTAMDIAGGDWTLNYATDGAEFDEWGPSMRRYSQFKLGETTVSGSAPPDHFGYDSRRYYASEFNNSVYLLLNHKGYVTYPKLHSNYRDEWRYYPDDFSRLQRDITVHRVYVNEEFTAYYHGK